MHDTTQPVTPSSTGLPPATDPAADLTGQTVGDFRILRRIGHGGMGHVYLAEQTSLKRKVALKFLRPDLAANQTALSRFRREAEAVARVTHANIVQVYAIGEAGGRHYMALEYVEGRNLRDYLARKGPLELPVALTVMRQVAAALLRAGESGIVHRDVKPENILLTRKGEVKVADFGLSRDVAGDPDLRLTQDGVSMGTPLYMSPEQAQGEPLDPRSDIYSFGVTCYHMLSGQPPFRGKTAYEVALKHVKDEPPPLAESRPDLPPPLCALVHRMMSKDPPARPQSGREVLRELNQAVGAAPAENPFAGMTVAQPVAGRLLVTPADATPAAGATAAGRPRRVGRWVAAAATVLLAAAGGVGLRLMQNARSAPPPADPHPNLAIVSEQERRLLTAVELYATPRSLDKIRQGAGHHVELGALYWDQKRYADAERLFEDMTRRPNTPPLYRTIGTVGLAVTYALRDEVERSNKAFLDVRTQGVKTLIPPGAIPPEDRINLLHWVVTALDRNATRPPVPKELEDLRKELRRRPNAGGTGKAG
ncbi:MAG TPA: serine/threonine-protein kinase [Gemmataceae bacterium]|jgi:serine/threonine-protein kinase